VRWDGRDGGNGKVGTGVYLYRVYLGHDERLAGKLLLMQ